MTIFSINISWKTFLGDTTKKKKKFTIKITIIHVGLNNYYQYQLKITSVNINLEKK